MTQISNICIRIIPYLNRDNNFNKLKVHKAQQYIILLKVSQQRRITGYKKALCLNLNYAIERA